MPGGAEWSSKIIMSFLRCADARGYGAGAHGYGADARGYGAGARGYGADTRGYGADARDFRVRKNPPGRLPTVGGSYTLSVRN